LKKDPSLRYVPVVMLTSSREGPDIEECYRHSANAYVVKPVNFAQFVDAVKLIGKFWAQLNETPSKKPAAAAP
jgi:CheY-like chemotaxis protein